MKHVTEAERAILLRLLHSGVSNWQQYRQQIDEFSVTRMPAGDPSLIFNHPDQGTPIQGSICEAEYKDKDGGTISLSLRTIGRYLHCLDVYKNCGSPILAPIEPENIEVYWPAEPGKKGWWEK